MSDWRSVFVQMLSAQRLITRSFIRIHILNLRDGSPYCSLPSNVITWELPPRVHLVVNDGMAITGSRVMMYASYWDEDVSGHGMVWRIAVWDWKTGDSARILQLVQS